MSYDDPPEVPILLLGDSGVGKSTFLSYVPHHLAISIPIFTPLILDPFSPPPSLTAA